MQRLKRGLAPPPRERILRAARELFYRDGLNAVSVDAIAAAAGTNKMTLYRHFSSKDELVAAYLSQLAEDGEGLWDKARDAHPGDADAQLRFMLKRASTVTALTSGGGMPMPGPPFFSEPLDWPQAATASASSKGSSERNITTPREWGWPWEWACG